MAAVSQKLCIQYVIINSGNILDRYIAYSNHDSNSLIMDDSNSDGKYAFWNIILLGVHAINVIQTERRYHPWNNVLGRERSTEVKH